VEQVHAAVGESGALIVCVHFEAAQAHVYLAAEESARDLVAKSIQTAGPAVEVTASDVKRLRRGELVSRRETGPTKATEVQNRFPGAERENGPARLPHRRIGFVLNWKSAPKLLFVPVLFVSDRCQSPE
jgi:hypothetical protein